MLDAVHGARVLARKAAPGKPSAGKGTRSRAVLERFRDLFAGGAADRDRAGRARRLRLRARRRATERRGARAPRSARFKPDYAARNREAPDSSCPAARRPSRAAVELPRQDGRAALLDQDLPSLPRGAAAHRELCESAPPVSGRYRARSPSRRTKAPKTPAAPCSRCSARRTASRCSSIRRATTSSPASTAPSSFPRRGSSTRAG